MKDQVLQIENLGKSFGKIEVLKNINFTLGKNKVYGLIGENGAGKTTLIRLIVGLMKPSCGKITLNAVKNYIGYMPQSCRFDDNATVKSTIKFFTKIRNASDNNSFDLCKKLDLDYTKKVKYLSPGQQKKMQMIIAMAGNPDLYILDQPTAGLDPSAANTIIEMIRYIHNEGKSIIISSHILQDMDSICTNVAIMNKGNLTYDKMIENSYVIKTYSLTPELLEKIKEQYNITYNTERNIIYVKITENNIPDFIRYLTSLSVDIIGVTASNVKSIAKKYMKGSAVNEN